MPEPLTLDQLRLRLTEIDRELVELIAERQRLSHEVARAKRATGHPTRDFRREREVILGARTHALRVGVSPEVAEQILRLLIRTSLATQEQARVAAEGQGTGKRALVIGGRGKMGRWFVDFLASQGFDIEVADPAGPVEGYPHRARWEDSPLDHDLLVVASPLGITAEVLRGLAARRPRGLVVDLASVKTPLREGLAIREKKLPGAWQIGSSQSSLGEALAGQQKYADAEPLLVAGYEGLKARAASIPARYRTRPIEALERLVQLYEAMGQKDQADASRKKLEETKAAAKPPAQP